MNMEMADEISETIRYRQSGVFPGEDLDTSIKVVLFNYGDGRTLASCVNGEWEGPKSELFGGSGIPHCPNGHVCMESSTRWRLGLIEESLSMGDTNK